MSGGRRQTELLRELHRVPGREPTTDEVMAFVRDRYDGRWQKLNDVDLMRLIEQVRRKLAGGDR